MKALLWMFPAALLALACSVAQAASSAVALTPPRVSVPGGESRVFSARFLDATGRVLANENVQFMNDACGSFGNGSSVMTVRTDADGIASATFTARNQGITCWVTASSGAQVRWDVLTFPLALVHFQTSMTPPSPRPGESFVLTVVPMVGVIRLYEAEVSARVVAGTASASIVTVSGNTGQEGSAAFTVVPDHRVGDYELEVSFRGRSQRIAVRAPEAPWQDMWWGGANESGWGVSIVQHRDTLFCVVYAYDASGQPTWYVMPGGSWDASRTSYTGALYRPRGASYDDYDAADLVVGASIGAATLTFVDGGRATLDYSVESDLGVRHQIRKALARQPFGVVDTAAAPSLADMWWGGSAQSGWGISVQQQYRSLFAVWFTYDAAGRATWMVMPSGTWTDASTYEGRLYRTSGSTFPDGTYDPRAIGTTQIGTFRFRFSGAGSGTGAGSGATFDYTIGAKGGTMALSRQPF